jgi:hypothetical protein
MKCTAPSVAIFSGFSVLVLAAGGCARTGGHDDAHDPDLLPPPELPPAAPTDAPATPPATPPPWKGGTPASGMVVHREVGQVLGVGVDEGANVWTVDGNAIWVLPPGGSWKRFTGVGQLARGERALTVCGGEAGKAYVGFWADELPEPLHSTFEQRQEGDVDRVALDDAGDLSLEFHHEFHNNNGITPDGVVKRTTFDETRGILSCVRVNDGPFQGEVYFGSNHGLTRVRGDDYGDHRHPNFDYPSCSVAPPGYECDEIPEAIGYVWGLGISNAGGVLMAAEWMFAEVRPNDPRQDHDLVRWTLNTHPWTFVGPPPFPLPGRIAPAWAPPWYARWPLRFAEPARNRAITQTPDGRYWVASERHGLVWFTVNAARLTPPVEVDGEPGTITALVPNPDGSLWVGTAGAGVWRYEPPPRPVRLADPPAPEVGTWTRLDGVPSGDVNRLYMETRSGKRQLYIATDVGLAVYTE